MGCGNSKENEPGAVSPRSSKPVEKSNHLEPISGIKVKPVQTRNEPIKANDFIAKQQMKPLPPVRKSIAFSVDLDGNENQSDGIVFRGPPKSLSRLAPIDNAPTLTAEALEEKLKVAEDKRIERMEQVKTKSRRSSVMAARISEARAFEASKMESDLKSKEEAADKKRLAQLETVKEKQRIREERRKRIQEKKKRMQSEEDANIDVEKDTEYQKDGDEPWEFDENAIVNDNADGDDDDWLGLTKSPRKNKKERDSGNGSTRGISASTVDSFDTAFQRKPLAPIIRPDAQKDDFFDS